MESYIEKAKEIFKPFETDNLMEAIRTMNVNSITSNPLVVCIFLGVLLYGIIKKSKTILLTLFTLVAVTILMKVAMPPAGEELSLKSLAPFALGGVGIGGVIIYFSLIKSD